MAASGEAYWRSLPSVSTSQSVTDEPIEVESGDGASDAHRVGGFVLADGIATLDDEPVERPALRLGE